MKLRPLGYGPQRLTRVAGRIATLGFVLGGVLLLWSGAIHFYLWRDEGYRNIATIGPLFVFQSVAGLVVGPIVMVVRRVWVTLLGSSLAISTVAGFLLSVEIGLFGFQDTWSAPYAEEAFLIEVATIVVLVATATFCCVGPMDGEPAAESSEPGLPSNA
ncbi:MAG TPA: hypothetical protein VMF35_07400 [Acidimicrobiales bacterium]|nr:hypothetical protein [Acidimicrobiales bacterium]